MTLDITRCHARITNRRTISVFIASPGDLAIERRAFRDCIVELNKCFGEGADVEFEALGWEDTLATTGRRNQGVINQEIDRCDVFILTMHCRWGQDAPDSELSSYTEEEFHRALKRFKGTGRPEIFVILKKISASRMADPGPQLQQVLDFRKALGIDEKIGDKEGMARHYCNLGNVYAKRGDLDRAEEMHLKSLEIDEELGRKEGIATTYGNLGIIAEEREDAVKARELWTKSRDLYEEIGLPHVAEDVQGWLDRLKNGSDRDSGG